MRNLDAFRRCDDSRLTEPSVPTRIAMAWGLRMFKFPCDSEFLEGFRRGERDVLARVYAEYVDEVESFVRSYFASQYQRHRLAFQGVDLEDVVQEIFTRAFGRTARLAFDVERPYGPFLGALARNLVIDWTRRRYPQFTPEDVELVAMASGPEVEAPWADAATMRLVSDYVAQLSPELREIHELRYVAARTQQEACDALGLSRQQLRTREMHLRDGLRRALKRAELEPHGALVLGLREGGSG
jgi:RNA polymerase sigma-70 factor, ECF subfamily